MMIDRFLLALMRVGGGIGWRAKNWLATRKVLRSPDRLVLQGPIFMALRAGGRLRAGNNILWIGCAPYTAGYYKVLEQDGARCSTIDIDPGQGDWGRRGRHIVGSALNLDRHYPPHAFDVILCNGVLGWGVDAIEDQRRAFSVMAQTLKPGGVLVVGWNTDTMADPVALNLHTPHFEHADMAGFPRRRAVPNSTHVYDCFRGVV